jgi:2-oxoglutarate dehydrogenase E2 component (dihydrolipoamide succinyltransferase)
VPEGETVEVGTVLAYIGQGDAAPVEAPPESPAPPVTEPEPAAAPVAQAPPEAATPAPTPVAASGNGKTFVSPVVARIAAEHGVDPSSVPGTGAGGRVTKKDILSFIESGAQAAPAPGAEPAAVPAEAPAAPAAPPPPAAAPAAAAPAAAQAEPELAPGEQLEPMTAMRRGVMEHMRRSVDTAAHVTSAIEVDFARVVALRQKLKPELAKQGINLTYLAFVARAAVDTLAEYPWINGELRGQSIVTRPSVNLGIAVALEEGKGLIVPVIRNAQDLNLQGMARAIADIAERARTKKLLPDDVQGGTFTITNPGSFGTFHGTPIINQPQSAILGTYALVKRPWVIQDELGNDVIAIRPIMNLTLTYDHRLVDGAYAGMYLRDLRARLESWDEAAY